MRSLFVRTSTSRYTSDDLILLDSIVYVACVYSILSAYLCVHTPDFRLNIV